MRYTRIRISIIKSDPQWSLLNLKEESTINAFFKKDGLLPVGRRHARAQKESLRIRGVYLYPVKMKEGTKMIQSVLFGFS